MTILVALKDEKEIIIGTDGQSTADDIICHTDLSKIHIKEIPVKKKEEPKKLYVMMTGYTFYSEVMGELFAPPKYKKRYTPYQYVSLFCQEFKQLLHECGWLKINNELTKYNGAMLIIFEEEIYEVQNDFGVLKEGEMAVHGSGWKVALGSLHSTKNLRSYDRVKLAIESCIDVLTNVGGEPEIMRIPLKEDNLPRILKSPRKETICVDFDGVLNKYNGYDVEDLGEPRHGACEFIEKLSEKYDVKILTARETAPVEEWLHNN